VNGEHRRVDRLRIARKLRGTEAANLSGSSPLRSAPTIRGARAPPGSTIAVS
jgi:hypothetical protein